VSNRTSRSRRALSDRVRSRNARHATVISQAVGSDGGELCQAPSARISASCTASSAVAKSAPRPTSTPSTRGTSTRSSTSASIGAVSR